MDINNGMPLEKKRVELLVKQFPFFISTTVFFAIIVTLISWNQSDRYILIGWITSYLIISILLHCLVRQYVVSNENTDIAKQRAWFLDLILCIFITGILWGLMGLYFLINNPVIHSSTVTIFLGGMVALSIAIFSVIPSTFYAFAMPALLPVIGWLLIQDQNLIKIIGFFMLVFLIFMSLSVLKLKNLIIDSISVEIENRKRLINLEKEKTDTSLLNDTLEKELRKIKHNDILLKREKQRAEELAEKLLAISTMDGLTGIHNRRYFDEFLAKEWNRAIRAGIPLSLILCDVDYFKNYNDYYGHQYGDKCLYRIANLLEGHARRSWDLAARYGGEEFGIILPETSLENASEIAEQIRTAVENVAIPHAASPINNIITVSFGVATVIPQRGQESRLLVSLADKALYKAKKEGRDRVVPAAPELYAAHENNC